MVSKTTDAKRLDCGILYGLRPQPRNKNRLAGLADWVQTVRSRDH